ncbi:hypothetical protein ALCH109712_09145 [Alkalicoccus chagannorensis]
MIAALLLFTLISAVFFEEHWSSFLFLLAGLIFFYSIPGLILVEWLSSFLVRYHTLWKLALFLAAAGIYVVLFNDFMSIALSLALLTFFVDWLLRIKEAKEEKAAAA